MENFIVVYDACVLYPAPLRDLLMQLATTGLFRAKWTDQIHEEWIRNVLKDRPDFKPEQMDKVRRMMDDNVLDCLVYGYEAIIPTLNLPDPNDRHILATAIKANADTIVTMNLKDFPANILKQYNIDAIHPDNFIKYLLDDEPGVVLSAIRTVRARLKNPPKTAAEYIAILLKQSLPLTASTLQEYEPLI